MTRIEKNPPLERAFSLAFHGGELRRRELRLTPEEAETLRAWADLTPMPGPEGENAGMKSSSKERQSHE